MTSKMFKMEDDIKNLRIEDDFKKYCKWKTTSKNLKMEDDLKIFEKGK